MALQSEEIQDKVAKRAKELSLALTPASVARKLIEEFSASEFAAPAYWLSLSGDAFSDKGLDIALYEYGKGKFNFRVGMLLGGISGGINLSERIFSGEIKPGKHVTAYVGAGLVLPYKNMDWKEVIPVGSCIIKF